MRSLDHPAGPNRLAAETSPYLRQHATNPVDWYPWGEEAFAEARRRDVPILLSVGYSACHWCHVMAHDCFEDPDTARTLNETFVNVKVDREERPDIDSIYMEAVQAVSGGGGWPMTVLLLPDGRPFFAGTYLPRSQLTVLAARVAQLWRSERPELVADASRLAEAVRSRTRLPGRGSPGGLGGAGPAGAGRPSSLRPALEALLARFDPEWGGFGPAPKFPQPCLLELLLQGRARGLSGPAGGPSVVEAVTTTLDAMASGGLYDHLGGGFARYSTDRRWLVPHFEKMLYDNALLARLYLHAWQVTGRPGYRQVVEETLGYLLGPPVRQAGGGFSSSEDADSEGVEGRFYTWALEEVLAVAGPETAEWFGVSGRGNWEGTNILWRPERGVLERPGPVEAGRRALLAARGRRVRPGLDDKVLAEWNAMAVAALAEAGAVLGRPEWVTAAVETAELLLASLRRADGRWLRSWQAGAGARHLAYASDHAWLVEAFTRLAEATGRARWIVEARAAADALIRLFWDDREGGFHLAGDDSEVLIARPKDTYDGALPSANSVATAALLRLSALTGERRYRDRAGAVIEAMGPALAQAPAAFSALAAAADLDEGGITEVAVTGDRPDLVAAVRARYRPDVVLAWGERYPSPLWQGRDGDGPGGQAYVCRDWICRAPVGDPGALAATLEAPTGPGAFG